MAKKSQPASPRTKKGQFEKGHAKLPNSGRKPGVKNKIQKTSVELLFAAMDRRGSNDRGKGKRDGYVDSILEDRTLGAKLFSKTFPKEIDLDVEGGVGSLTVNILPVARGNFISPVDGRLVDEATARKEAGVGINPVSEPEILAAKKRDQDDD